MEDYFLEIQADARRGLLLLAFAKIFRYCFIFLIIFVRN